MAYAIIGIFAFLVGGLVAYVLTERKRKEVATSAKEIASEWHRVKEAELGLNALRAAHENKLKEERIRLAKLATELDHRVIKYSELQAENENLKAIQRVLAQNVRKHDLDIGTQQATLEDQMRHTNELAKRYLTENVKWIAKSINANNYAASKQKLLDIISRCRSIGFEVTVEEEAVLLNDLKQEFEKAVRAALEREEQARIKAQIRDDLLREREVQRELDRIGREKAAIEAALAVALAQARDEHDAEVEDLRRRLAEAEASQRAISQAQITKAGYVYVISNIGSFGEGVYKIGMTRRLAPMDRVRELGDASVPFPFDVHMLISATNAPELERHLHKTFYKKQINRVNPRREFFRLTLEEIAAEVRHCHGDVEYQADAEALEYRQSINMTDDDQEYIEHVYEEFDENDVDALEPLVDAG